MLLRSGIATLPRMHQARCLQPAHVQYSWVPSTVISVLPQTVAVHPPELHVSDHRAVRDCAAIATPTWESQSAADCWLVSCLQLTTGEKMVGLSLNPEIAARVIGDVENEFGELQRHCGQQLVQQPDRA